MYQIRDVVRRCSDFMKILGQKHALPAIVRFLQKRDLKQLSYFIEGIYDHRSLHYTSSLPSLYFEETQHCVEEDP